MISLTLPWPPSVNHYWRSAVIKNHVQVYISQEGKRYRKSVETEVWVKRLPKLLGRLKIAIVANPPDRRTRDLDNLLKALFDALAHAGVYGTDAQIDEVVIRRGIPMTDGEVRVEIEELPMPLFAEAAA